MKPIIVALSLLALSFQVKAQQINEKIQEVYGAFAQQEVYNNPTRLSYITDVIVNRVKIVESPVTNDKYPKLSSIPLLNKYNSALTYDAVFNPDAFNPIKYNFNFYTNANMVYRVDNTNYIIIIEPQKINK
jgi:hypothetical protein